MKYKALMLDLDGTTVPNSVAALPSTRVIEAIKKAEEKLHVGIATGRTLIESIPILEKLSLSGPSVVHGGAQVIDASTKEVVWEKRIDTQSVKEVIAIFAQFNISVSYNTEDTNEHIPLTAQKFPKNPLSLWHYGLEPEVAEALVDKLSNIPTISVSKTLSWDPTKYVVFVTHLEATKQHGIFEVAKLLGIETHEIIGVGDSYNDFPLLMASGLKIAMGNAAQDLKDIADFVAPSVEEDGVAVIIEKFILQE